MNPAQMTRDQKNRAIAKWLEWYVINPPEEDGMEAYSVRHPTELTLYPWYRSEEEAWRDASDFCGDLNATRDAELSLQSEDRHEYYRCLHKLTKPAEYEPEPGCDAHTWAFITATAEQRADALIAALNMAD